MATGNTIEAKLRIAAEVAQAVGSLKNLRTELRATSKEAADAGKAQRSASGTDDVVSQVQRRGAAERQALAESKRVLRERSDAEKAAAKERQSIADDDLAKRRKADQDEQRRVRTLDEQQKKAARLDSYRKSALAPQVTDIAVGLATGQSPITVALQQGGQLRDIYGSAGGALRALLGLLTPMRLLVGGVAAGFALVASNIAAGYREGVQLNKTLALTGNTANTSLGQINAEARAISSKTATSIGVVRDVLGQLLLVHGQTSATLNGTGRAVVALSKLTGQSGDEIVKQFADQAAGVTDWAVKANKAYNFLTAKQVDYIRSLERQGRVAEAIKFTNEELADSLQQRSVQAIGALEKGWNAVGVALGNVLEKLKAIGRDETPEERLAKLQENLRDLLSRREGANQPKTLDPNKSIVGQLLSRDKKIQDNLQKPAVSDDEIEQARAAVEWQKQLMDIAAKASAERAQAAREEQEKIKRGLLDSLQAQAADRVAQAERAFAQKQAELDRSRELVESDYARELISANTQATRLNAIERQRVQSEIALLYERIAAEKALDSGRSTPEQANQGRAQKEQLQAQLIALQSRLTGSVAEARRIVDGEINRLDDDIRQRAAANTLAAIDRTVTEPAERARATALAATSQARKELEDLERYREAQAGSGDGDLLARLKAQIDEARKALQELTRKTELDTLQRDLAERFAALAGLERDYDRLVEEGVLTTVEGEAKKDAARAATVPVLRQIVELQRQLAQGPGEQNTVKDAARQVGELESAAEKLEKSLRASGRSGFTQFLDDVTTGAKSGKGALLDMVASFGKALLHLLNQKLAEQLFKSLEGLGSEGGGSGGGWLKAITTIFAGVQHSGGVVGEQSNGAARAVSPLVFAGAQVLHSGGIAGLRSGEVPTILEAGEEVLRADDPRHRNNIRGSGLTFNASYTFNGTGGGESEAEQRQFAKGLDERIHTVVRSYVTDQQRQGGVFAR